MTTNIKLQHVKCKIIYLFNVIKKHSLFVITNHIDHPNISVIFTFYDDEDSFNGILSSVNIAFNLFIFSSEETICFSIMSYL